MDQGWSGQTAGGFGTEPEEKGGFSWTAGEFRVVPKQALYSGWVEALHFEPQRVEPEAARPESGKGGCG